MHGILNKTISFFLCFCFLFSVSACKIAPTPADEESESSAVPEKTDSLVVATVNGQPIYLDAVLADYQSILSYYQQSGYSIEDLDEQQICMMKDGIIEQLILEEIAVQKAEELGFGELSAEAAEEIKASIESAFNSMHSYFEEMVLAEIEAAGDETMYPDVKSEAQARADAYLQESGISRNAMLESRYDMAKIAALEEAMDAACSITEDDVQAWYNENLEMQQKAVRADPTMYESYARGEGGALYVPEGVIKVQQILIKAQDEKIANASALYYDGYEEDASLLLGPEYERLRAEAEEALTRAQAGENFSTLIEEYSDDASSYALDGYVLVPGTQSYLQEFTDAAFALEKDGDISPLVKSIYGYHIIRRIRAVEPGPVAFDDAYDAAYEAALSRRQDAHWNEQIEAWQKEAKVEIYEDVLYKSDNGL